MFFKTLEKLLMLRREKAMNEKKDSFSKKEEYEIELLLEQRREIEAVLNNHENYLIRSAEAIIGAHVVVIIFTSNDFVHNFLENPVILFLLIQFYLITAGWTVAVLAGRDEDREYIMGIDYVLRKKYDIRTSFHDGGIFMNRGGAASLFKKVAAFVAGMMFLTFFILIAIKAHDFMYSSYWWVLPIIIVEFTTVVIFAIEKSRKSYKKKLQIVNMVIKDCDLDASGYAEHYRDIF